jgi:succinate dehydrogenase / fumarate reductase, cytochrome b subunit
MTTSSDVKVGKVRPKYYDLNLANLPPTGLVSIFHRITGVAMVVFMIPLTLALLQMSLKSEAGFAATVALWNYWFVKVIVLGFALAFIQHFYSGIRFLLIDAHYGVDKQSANRNSLIVMALSVITTLLLAVKVW